MARSADAKEPVDVRLCDFDDVSYHVVMSPDTPGILEISLSCTCFSQLKEHGVMEQLRSIYGGYLANSPNSGSNVTLRIDLNQTISSPDTLIKEITLLKTNVLGGPLYYYLSKLQEGKSDNPTKIAIRGDTILHIFPKADRCTVIYMLDFHEKSDLVIGQVFLNAFNEVRKTDRTIASAPICTFDVKPPLDMKYFNIDQPIGTVGFLSITLLNDHVKTNEKKITAVQMMHMLRNYVQYHIKCSKAYFHSRMRARVVEMLKVMNRAQVEPFNQKVQKTATGRTFIRTEKDN